MTDVVLRIKVHENHWGKIASGVGPKVDALVAKAALDVEAWAKTFARVDTGNMRALIQATKAGEWFWRITFGADYTVYHEYGTVHMAAQPMARPAIAKVRPQFRAALQKVLQP